MKLSWDAYDLIFLVNYYIDCQRQLCKLHWSGRIIAKARPMASEWFLWISLSLSLLIEVLHVKQPLIGNAIFLFYRSFLLLPPLPLVHFWETWLWAKTHRKKFFSHSVHRSLWALIKDNNKKLGILLRTTELTASTPMNEH